MIYDWEAEIKRIRLQHPFFGNSMLELSYNPPGWNSARAKINCGDGHIGGTIVMKFSTRVPDRERESGERIAVVFQKEVRIDTLDPLGLYLSVREFLFFAVTHEVDEMLLVDGNRITDPHPPHVVVEIQGPLL